MTPVLVLGASGFIGRHLVAALAESPDFQPIALVHRDGAGFPPGVALRRADATDPAALREALSGVGAAVNCIAGSEAAMVGATRNLCEAAAPGAVSRIVHLSSMAVYGPATGLVDEAAPLDPSLGAYARAKVACEELVAAASGRGVETVILRPGCVHGPGSAQWTERLGRLLRQHRIGDLGEAGDGACNLTYVDDLTRAILAALRNPEAKGQAFNVSDPAPGTWNDYLVALGRAIGAVPVTRISPRWIKVETKVLAPALIVAQRAAARLSPRIRLPAAVSPSLARTWHQDIVLDHRKADAGLGFRRIPPAEALAAAVTWLQSVS